MYSMHRFSATIKGMDYDCERIEIIPKLTETWCGKGQLNITVRLSEESLKLLMESGQDLTTIIKLGAQEPARLSIALHGVDYQHISMSPIVLDSEESGEIIKVTFTVNYESLNFITSSGLQSLAMIAD